MANGQLPPADWYTDPDDPSQLRYWDGAVWTEHRHPVGAELPSFSNFLEQTFSVAWARVIPCLILTVILGVPAAILSQAAIRLAAGDIVVSSDGIEGWSVPAALGAAGLLLIAQVLSIFYWTAVAHQLYWGHRRGASSDDLPSWQGSLAAGLRRGIPALLTILLVVLVYYGITVLLVVLAAVVFPPLLIVVVPVLLVAGVWLGVKLAFLVVAAAVKPAGTSSIAASMQVSKGRFWPLVGRLLLLLVIVVVFGSVVSSVAAAIGTPAFDAPQLTEGIENDGVVALKDVVPGPIAGSVIAVVSSLLNLAAIAILGSGLAALYRSAQGSAADTP